MEGLNRDSFIFYKSFYEAIAELESEEDQLAALKAIIEYALGILDKPTSGVAAMALKFAKPQIDANNRKYENGKKGGRATNKEPNANQTETKPKPNANQTETKAEPNTQNAEPNVNVNVNDNVNVFSKENIGDTHQREERARRFTAPTVEDVRQYAREHGYRVNAEKFCDYYASNGWKVGKNPMKDWRAAVRNWVRQEDRYGDSNSPQRETEQGTTREAWRKVRIVQG